MTVAQQNQRPISDVRVVAGSRLRSITLNAGEDPALLPPGGRHSPQPATPPPSTEHPAIPSTWTSLDALQLKTKTETQVWKQNFRLISDVFMEPETI